MDIFDIDYIDFKLRETGYDGSRFDSIEDLAIRYVSTEKENLELRRTISNKYEDILNSVKENYKAYGFRQDYVAVEELLKMTIEDFLNRFYQEGP